MNWKLISCLLICGVAALCPAPIKDTSAKPHALPIMSAEQQAAGQRFDGTQSVVGTVPKRTNPDGTGPLIESNAKGAATLNKVSPEIEARAVSNITKAERAMKLDGHSSGSPIFVLLLVLALVGGALFAAKTYLEKYGPAPQRYRPQEKLK